MIIEPKTRTDHSAQPPAAQLDQTVKKWGDQEADLAILEL